MKASDYIVDFIAQAKTDTVFGYIGGMITHITDSIALRETPKLVNTITEQGAGFAAEGYARATGNTGVALATSGPGATNLLTTVASCYFDSTPVVFITGQVNTYEYKYDRSLRQVGFQETDICKMAAPVTKYAVLVDKADHLRYELEKAFFLSRHGRPGPVLIDIPMNIQRADISPEKMCSFFDSAEYAELKKYSSADNKVIAEIAAMLRHAARPIIIAGGGVRLSGAIGELERFLSATNIPVVHSLMGKDAVSGDYPYNMGFIGAYGNRFGNLALANADCVMVLGSRLDSRQTGTDVKSFCHHAAIIHVDIDHHELNAKVKAAIAVHADIKEVLCQLNRTPGLDRVPDEWHASLLKLRKKYPSEKTLRGEIKWPNKAAFWILQAASSGDIFCVDVGQHQMWMAQTANGNGGQRFIFSGGMGAMGFALPAAIGASVGTGRRAIVVVGDGGMQMNIQELEILKRRNLPVKIFILNNFCLGMVRQFQEIYFHERYISTIEDYSVPNFASVAEAYGLKALTVNVDDNFAARVAAFLSDDSPGVMNIHLPYKTEVEPKLIVNHPIEDMYPFLSREELSENIISIPEKDLENQT